MTGSELPPENGECIGPYRIVRILGRGGMGEVFLARDDRLKRSVAIKRIRHDGELTPTLRQRLLREAQAVAGLSHPAIVHVYDLLEGTDDDCIVMEYIQGATLAEMLKGGALEPAAALRLAREIASGLDAAHAAGIVHRDLKAENVIVTPAGQGKILDFGLAKPLAPLAGDPSLTAAGFVVGTWRSMSPEQARGAEVDERSDLFSFGVLLYEMLTGQSPFRGSAALEILTRVMSLTPPRVDTVQPGLSPRLGTLIGRLLEKEPDARPQSAAEVMRELAVIAADSAFGSPSAETISALPTGFLHPATPPPSQALPRSAAAPHSTAGMSVIRRRGLRTAAGAVLAVVLLATFGFLIGRRFQPVQRSAAPAIVPASLRVVVPQPQVNSKDKRLQLAASGILTTSLGTLSSLVGVDAIDSSQLQEGVPIPQMAEAAAADELLVAILDEMGHQGRITLRRQSRGGQILWTETFLAPVDDGDLLQLAKRVDTSLLRGYKDRRLRPGTPTLAARTEDYAAFLAVKQRLDAGDVPSEDDLERLQQVMDKSPRLLAARLLAADVLLNRFISTKKVAYRDRALNLVRGARELAPDDPRPLFTQFRAELDRPSVAANTLARIERLLPGDPRVLVFRSGLAEREGRQDEALDDLRSAVQSSPSWRNLMSLADLESRTGHVEEARGHLNQILRSSPGNVFALDYLARIELLFGDLHQAEQRYQDLIDQTPKPLRAHYTNLGVARILLGHYQEAITALHKALEIDPDNSDVNLNLAQAELALGRTRDAKSHFRKALSEIEKNPIPENSLSKAECLAYLHRRREAVAIILDTPEQKHDDPDVLKSAALVSALVRDHATALATVERALQKGVQTRWFLLPGFNYLRRDPEFQELLSKAPGARG